LRSVACQRLKPHLFGGVIVVAKAATHSDWAISGLYFRAGGMGKKKQISVQEIRAASF
jgi:hypothetical protein